MPTKHGQNTYLCSAVAVAADHFDIAEQRRVGIAVGQLLRRVWRLAKDVCCYYNKTAAATTRPETKGHV